MRGRRAQPDAVKALKGNPGKRRLLLEGDKSASAADRLAASAATAMPEYLSGEREREIFRRVVDDYLQRRVARPADLNAYARWAHYLHRWILCKEALDGQTTFFKSESKWGTMFRRHPLFKDLLDLERVMQSLGYRDLGCARRRAWCRRFAGGRDHVLDQPRQGRRRDARQGQCGAERVGSRFCQG